MLGKTTKRNRDIGFIQVVWDFNQCTECIPLRLCFNGIVIVDAEMNSFTITSHTRKTINTKIAQFFESVLLHDRTNPNNRVHQQLTQSKRIKCHNTMDNKASSKVLQYSNLSLVFVYKINMYVCLFGCFEDNN